eukprot:5236375-Amphidinium_carterae.1
MEVSRRCRGSHSGGCRGQAWPPAHLVATLLLCGDLKDSVSQRFFSINAAWLTAKIRSAHEQKRAPNLNFFRVRPEYNLYF